MDFDTWRREDNELGALLSLAQPYIQVDQHLCSVTLRLIVMVEYWVVDEMRNAGFEEGRVIIVGRIIFGGYCTQWR